MASYKKLDGYLEVRPVLRLMSVHRYTTGVSKNCSYRTQCSCISDRFCTMDGYFSYAKVQLTLFCRAVHREPQSGPEPPPPEVQLVPRTKSPSSDSLLPSFKLSFFFELASLALTVSSFKRHN